MRSCAGYFCRYARHGGSAISGKDLTNVGRTGIYAARHVAKNLVAAGIAEECEVHLSYAIGKPSPILTIPPSRCNNSIVFSSLNDERY